MARYLLGVARFLLGQPAAAIALWDDVVQSGAPGAILTEIPFWRGVAQARLGDLEGGLELLNRFVATVPVNHPLRGNALVQAGWIALDRKAADEAVRRFLEAEAAGPRPELRPQIRAGLVRAYLALGDTGRAASAARLLKTESARDPLVPAALLLIADAAKARGTHREASDIYRELLLLPLLPSVHDYVRFRLGEALEQEGRLLEAKDQYRELRDRGRDVSVAERATYRLGLVALRENDTATARREGEALLRAGTLPELREGVLLLLVAESAMGGNDPNRAVAVLRTALRDYPDSPRSAQTRLALGWALLQDGDAETALREWSEVATAGNPEIRAHALIAMADVALRQGREGEALDALRGVTTPPPGLRNADAVTLNRGILALRTGAYAEAVQSLEPLAPRIADLAMQGLAHRALGVAQFKLGRHDQAERQFRLAANATPQEPSSWLGAGLAALAQGRHTEAEDALQRARFAAVDVATSAWYGLVLVSVQRGDREAFRERGTNFVDRLPKHPAVPAVLYGLAVAALERKDLGEGQAWTQRLLREHAASDYGTDALIRLAEAAGSRQDIARQAYRDLLTRSAPADVRASAWLGLAESALAAGDNSEAQRAAEGFLREVPPDDPRAARAHLVLVRTLEAQGADGPSGHRVRPIERTLPPPRVPEVAAIRPPALDPSELALPRRPERENPTLPAPSTRPIERTLPPPPPVTPPVAAPAAPPAPSRLPEPPRLPSPPAAPALTYYLRQLHAKVSEQWRRPPAVSSAQSSTVIYFEITREGQMRGEPRIKQSSGNELYDQAGLRAVVGSFPFPRFRGSSPDNTCR